MLKELIYWFQILFKYIFKQRPLSVIYFITQKCNLKCAHCFINNIKNSDFTEMTISEIKNTALKIGKILYIDITGGEPFMRKDIFEVYNLFLHICKPKKITITTNGFYSERIIEFAVKVIPFNKIKTEIIISIDDLEERHDQVRGKQGAFKQAIHTFQKLKALSLPDHLSVCFMTTFMKSNEKTIKNTISYLQSLDPDSIGINLIRGEVNREEEKNIDFNVFDELFQGGVIYKKEKYRSLIQQLRFFKVNRLNQLRRDIYKNKKQYIPCSAGSGIAVIYSDGTVNACEMKNNKIGNLKNFSYDIKKIWSSKEGNAVRRKIANERCYCTHECFIAANITYNPVELIKLFFLFFINKLNIKNARKN